MNKYVVTATAIPTNYNRPQCFVIEAANEKDALEITKHHLKDLSGSGWVYVYAVKPYVPPPAGSVIS